ncbi:MAG: tRNA (adenosine(37)-N6)-threonylcarbamoyltransferase complex dimerization subunit type 1 TsaB [Corallococcus sp.]|nr:tRNA (adenosine(37)-N6)-threonylcarbamoyltransferase complex dimerization subunit type 1 TsaB [Corallococcus sp.]
MNILLVDTTTDSVITAVVREGDAVADISDGCRGKASERLCHMVQGVMERAGITFDKLDAYACAEGPGSFTGIRIGVSTVKGYLFAKPKKCIAYNNLEMLSKSYGGRGAVIDAGNGYYYARYGAEQTEEPQLIDYDDIRAEDAARYTTAEEHLKQAVCLVREKYLAGEFADGFHPLYIRKSQAEMNR